MEGLGGVRELHGKKDALGGSPLENRVPLWGPFWTPFRHFFLGPPGHKKGGPGGPSKLDPFFVAFRVCPEGLRRVPVSTGAQFSLLQPGPKRAPKWEPKWSVLGSRILTILALGHHGREIGALKIASQKKTAFSRAFAPHVAGPAECAGAVG